MFPETGAPPVGPVITMAGAALFETDETGEHFKENPADAEFDLESWTLAIKVYVPAEVAVPAIVPVAEFIVRPLGSCPLVCDHE